MAVYQGTSPIFGTVVRPFDVSAVNWTSPHAIGLKSWMPFRQGYDCRDILQPVVTPVKNAAFSVVGRPQGGAGLAFNGTTNYVSWGDSTPYEFASGQSFSIAIWFYGVASATQEGLLTKGYDSVFGTNDFPWYLMRWNAGTLPGQIDLFLRSSTPSDANPNYDSNLGTGLHHVVGIYDAAQAKAFVYPDGRNDRGAQTVTGVTASAYGTNTSPLVVGTHNAGWFSGQIFDVRFYNRALDFGEVRSLYEPTSRWDLYGLPAPRIYRGEVANALPDTRVKLIQAVQRAAYY